MFHKLKTINPLSLAFLLVVIAVSTSLTDSTVNRNAFYLATLFAIIAFIFSRPRTLSRDVILTAIAVFCVSISQAFWLWRFPALESLEINEEYLTSATRLLCGAVLIFTLGSLREKLDHKIITFAKGLLVIGFFYATSIALYLHEQSPEKRLEINTVATMTAYIYVLQSLLTVYVLTGWQSRYKHLAIAIVILLSLWVILLTETRSSLLGYPIFLLLLLFRKHHFSCKNMLIGFFVFLASATATYYLFTTATERLANSVNELANYQKGDGNSSIGARISMWKAGAHAIEQMPEGQSAASRLKITAQYINQYEGGNPEALRNLTFHLHNDFIEAGSLQGLLGILALIFFYLLIIHASIKYSHTKAVLLLLLLPTLVIGAVDTLFIDHRYVTNLTLMLAIYLCLQRSGLNSIGINAQKN
ncbi:O-antigen ligase family protein [Serratia sp. NPDC078593]|uniref:O-antigen ligase family protein n=1 Tax=unclassified Serratia (in: enterobacteria) TaxID=2647522 RepID=UPI0037CFA8F2